jgi:hypothetical protein
MATDAAPPRACGDGALASIAIAGYGGLHATILSAVALVISGFSLYETSFKTAALEVYVPPVIRYARDGDGSLEVFAIPITITNGGARTGTVLSMELEAKDAKTGKAKRYYSAFLGEHQVDANATNRSFAPLSIPGHATFTDTVRFYPVGDALPRLLEDAGDVAFTLKLVTAAPADPDFVDRLLQRPPQPVAFARTLPWISEEQLGSRRITIPMFEKAGHEKASNPATATGK